MRHFDAFVRWTAALLLTVLSIACGKDKTTTTEGSAITGGSWSQTETIEAAGAQKDFTGSTTSTPTSREPPHRDKEAPRHAAV